MSLLRQLWAHNSKRRQKQFWFLLVIMVLASLVESLSIGAILPFLAALTSPEVLFNHHLMQPIINLLELENPEQLLLPLTLIFVFAILLSGAIRLLLLFILTKFSFLTGAELSLNIYRRTLYQDYPVHLSRNSSEVINGIVKKTDIVISHIFVPFLTFVSSIILLLGIIVTLLIVNFLITILLLTGFGIMYIGIIYIRRKKITENSQIIAKKSDYMIKVIQEGLGSIRDVIFEAKQEFYSKLYHKADYPFRLAEGNNQFIAASPKFVIESLGILLIALVALYLTSKQNVFSNHIPILGILVLGSQKMLPIIQQAYASYTKIKGAHSSLEDVIHLLNQQLPKDLNVSRNNQKLTFKKELSIKNLCFSHNGKAPMLFNNVNFVIPKGSKIGFVGKTGTGKSTLLDIIMGLLKPIDGEIIIDGQVITAKNLKDWQSQISHVPQNIFLIDDSIESNIAFGVPKDQVDSQRVIDAAIQAQIHDVIEHLSDKYETSVGERGLRLSEGQKQRIVIARSLYKNFNVLIFDEATSALDNETEDRLMRTFDEFNGVTMLIIAHRISTLKNCDQIIEMIPNKGIRIGTFQEIFPEF